MTSEPLQSFLSATKVKYDTSDQTNTNAYCGGCGTVMREGEIVIDEHYVYKGKERHSFWHVKCWNEQDSTVSYS